MKHSKFTVFRVILFCFLCAVALAVFSGIVKGWLTEWKQHALLIITIGISYGLTLWFVKWERLRLKDVGLVATSASMKKVAAGFGIGLLMTMLQPAGIF